MKTIVLFHRLELTDLYAPLARELEGKMKLVHLAYGSDERNNLLRQGVTAPIVIFKEEIKRIWNELDTPSAAEIEAIDATIIEQSKGAFNLNGAIQSDRGFTLLSYGECIKLTVVYHRFWQKFLADHDIDYVMHEPTSLMMNFIAALVCQRRGAQYIYQIMCKGDHGDLSHLIMSGFEFTCPQMERNFDSYVKGQKAFDQSRCEVFINKFRAELSVYLGDKIAPSLSWSRLLGGSLFHRLRWLTQRRRIDRCIDNIEYWSLQQDRSGNKLINLMRYAAEVKFHEFEPGVPYYYYPLHLEPEAVVLYHGHGLYRNQVKLIENIAAQLPPDTFLYVKDHPHAFGYRSADDFNALQKIPNIRLIRPEVPGKLIINHAIGVITITGTAGFEALLMGKQIYTFGKTFYSVCSRVNKILHIRDLRAAIYSNRDRQYHNDNELYQFVAAYLDSANDGMVDYFVGRAGKYGLNLDENSKVVAGSILKFVAET
jgi:hypothetical protein